VINASLAVRIAEPEGGAGPALNAAFAALLSADLTEMYPWGVGMTFPPTEGGGFFRLGLALFAAAGGFGVVVGVEDAMDGEDSGVGFAAVGNFTPGGAGGAKGSDAGPVVGVGTAGGADSKTSRAVSGFLTVFTAGAGGAAEKTSIAFAATFFVVAGAATESKKDTELAGTDAAGNLSKGPLEALGNKLAVLSFCWAPPLSKGDKLQITCALPLNLRFAAGAC
jgi:hypothetical protein